VAAVIASPVRFARKIPGLAIGVPSLLAINLLRVVSLFYIGVHHKEIFERVHYEIWQAVFIVLAVVFWAIWVQWATRRRTGQEP
jgi:exosortase/archaeosortase family protein